MGVDGTSKERSWGSRSSYQGMGGKKGGKAATDEIQVKIITLGLYKRTGKKHRADPEKTRYVGGRLQLRIVSARRALLSGREDRERTQRKQKPSRGRWLSAAPITEKEGLSWGESQRG